MADDRGGKAETNQKTGQHKQNDAVQGGGHGGGQPKQDDNMRPSTRRIHDGGATAGSPPSTD